MADTIAIHSSTGGQDIPSNRIKCRSSDINVTVQNMLRRGVVIYLKISILLISGMSDIRMDSIILLIIRSINFIQRKTISEFNDT